MAASIEAIREFLFTWKIKCFDEFKHLVKIESPVFRVEILDGSEWTLNLYEDGLNVMCELQLIGYSKASESNLVYFQYELTNSTGVVLKTSDILSNTFAAGCFSQPYDIMELKDIYKVYDPYFLLCRMISPHITIPVMPKGYFAIDCKAETELFPYQFESFEFSFKFSIFKEWSAVEKVNTKNIPLEITFKYVNDDIQIELLSKIKDKSSHHVFIRMKLLNEEKLTVKWQDDTFQFSDTSKVWKFPTFAKKRNLEKAKCFINKEIKMEMLYQCRYHSLISSINCKDDSKNVKSITNSKVNCLFYLQQHLKNMFIDKSYADVKLRSDGEIFFAHKCLLTSRSPVFKVMLDQDMLERKTGVIDIPDVEAKILKLFLEYLYTGAMNEIDDEIALSLLVVADKYQVSPLIENCSNLLMSVLCFDNVLDILLVADMVNQEQLKLSALEYIVQNSTKILSSPVWLQWMKINPTIASEIFLQLSRKFDSVTTGKERLIMNHQRAGTLLNDSASRPVGDVHPGNTNRYGLNMPNTPLNQDVRQEHTHLTSSKIEETGLKLRQSIGKRLFPKIHSMFPDDAEKITGMLLEDLKYSELKDILNHNEALKTQAEKANSVLQDHRAKEKIASGAMKNKS